MKDKTRDYVIASFIMFIGAVFLISSSYFIITRYNISNSGVVGLAKVFKIEHINNSDTDALVFWVKYEYKGEEYVMHNSVMDSDSIYHINELVPVRILDSEPNRAIIDSSKEKYSGFILPACIGLFVLMAGVVFIWYLNKKQ